MRYKVDGYGKDRWGQIHVLEYNGCVWHGCPDCFPERTELLDGRLACTKDKEERLAAIAVKERSPYKKFTFTSTWTCQVNRELRANPEFSSFAKRYMKSLHRKALDPRATFKGGKTETFKHLVVVDHSRGEKLLYLDFTSLYPSVNAGVNGEVYPVGHPDIYLSDDIPLHLGNVTDGLLDGFIFGLVKCEVYPPRQLMHPVLGVSHDSKLIFSLCLSCTQEQNQDSCQHTDEERKFTGEFVSVELAEALKLGYKLGKVFEVWNWSSARQSKTLFKVANRGFIETCLS